MIIAMAIVYWLFCMGYFLGDEESVSLSMLIIAFIFCVILTPLFIGIDLRKTIDK